MVQALLLRYIGMIFLISFCLICLAFVLSLFNLELPNMSFLVALLAAMDAGQYYFRKTGRLPESGDKWKLSFLMILLQFAIGVPIALVILYSKLPSFDGTFVLFMTFALLFIGILYVVMSYFFIGIGAKKEFKKLGEVF